MNHLIPNQQKFLDVEADLKKLFGDEPWFISTKIEQDDGGKILCINVNMDLYPHYTDPVKRSYECVPVAVVKRPVIIKIDELKVQADILS